jgi:hypothetical protein
MSVQQTWGTRCCIKFLQHLLRLTHVIISADETLEDSVPFATPWRGSLLTQGQLQIAVLGLRHYAQRVTNANSG